MMPGPSLHGHLAVVAWVFAGTKTKKIKKARRLSMFWYLPCLLRPKTRLIFLFVGASNRLDAR